MKPYYQSPDDGVTLYCGDARDVVPMVVADVVVTDPPYGVNLGHTKGAGGRHGLRLVGYDSYVDSRENFEAVIVPVIRDALAKVTRAAVFANSVGLSMLPTGSATGGVYCPAGVGRHAWGFCVLHPILFYGSAPNLHLGAKHNVLRSTARAEKNGHPCPKPIEWMVWLIGLTSLPQEVVLDPFAGSGSTLVAAAEIGRRAVGIEIEERYCEIAARRLEAAFDGEPTPIARPRRLKAVA